MNGMYLSAGLLAAGGVLFHGVWGYLVVPARLDATVLPRTGLGDGRETLWMLRLGWHSLTVIFGVIAVTLIRLGINDTGETGAPRALGAILGLLALVWVLGGGSRRRFLHPGLPVVVAVTALTLIGTL